MKNSFDCVIPVARRDRFFVEKTISYITENVSPARIVLIANIDCLDRLKKYLPKFDTEILVLDEDSIVKNLNSGNLLTELQTKFPDCKSSGWYLQQFLKMGYCNSVHCRGDYLVWDADTLPINPVKLFNNNNDPLIYLNEAFRVEYFNTVHRLLGLKKILDKSFIFEFMFIRRVFMQDLIIDISKLTNTDREWFNVILDNTEPREFNSFSEYETYGTYVFHNNPNHYKISHLNKNRHAARDLTRLASSKRIQDMTTKYDVLSFEHQMHAFSTIGAIDFIVKVSIYIYDKIFLNFKKFKNRM